MAICFFLRDQAEGTEHLSVEQANYSLTVRTKCNLAELPETPLTPSALLALVRPAGTD